MSYNAWRITYQNAELAAQVAYQAARQHLEQVERLKQQLENLRYAGDRVIRGGEGAYVWNLAVNDSAQPSLVQSRIAELEEQASEAAAERDSYQREFARATEVLGEIHEALNGSGPSIVGMEAVQVLQLKGERDVLAAHVERLREAFKKGYQQDFTWTWVKEVLDEAPITSLARLKAEWQAQALEELLQNTSQFREANPVRGLAGSMADELRQQAGGGEV